MFDLKSYLTEKKTLIDAALEKIFLHPTDSERVNDAMRYSVMAGGKRLRPILCLAAVEALSGDIGDDMVIQTACALEMVHTYSLIHDDLPAMDDDDLRRGRPTCHIAFDEPTAILAGDALVTLAFESLAITEDGSRQQMQTRLKIIQAIGRAAGHTGMIAGQMIDMAAEGSRLSLPELERMYRLKTGALIEASVHAGALLAGAPDEAAARLVAYAARIGLAFQIVDDILDIQGDPAVTGKPTGSDRDSAKNTYPAIVGIERSNETARQQVNHALQDLAGFDNKADPLRAIAAYIIERKH